MNLFLLSVFLLVALLLGVFVLSARHTRRLPQVSYDSAVLEDRELLHAAQLPQIWQALGPEDDEFLRKRAPSMLRQRVRGERRRVALAYLTALRGDFQSLLRTARIIAVLSPEVVAVQELERLRLTVQFVWRYELIRMKLLVGLAPLPQLNGLSHLISGLSVRMETAMKELGERAALAAELTSSLDRRGGSSG